MKQKIIHRHKGFIERIIQRIFFSRLEYDFNINCDQSKDSNKVIIFAISGSRILDFWLISFIAERLGLPPLVFGTGLNSIYSLGIRRYFFYINRYIFKKKKNPYQILNLAKTSLDENYPFLLNLARYKLRREKYTSQLIDTIHETVKYAYKSDKEILLYPVATVWQKKSKRTGTFIKNLIWGSPVNPGLFRKLLIFIRTRKTATIRTCNPIKISELIKDLPVERSYDTSRRIRAQIIEEITLEKQIILGPSYRSARHVIGTIMLEPSFAKNMKDYAAREKRSLKSVHRKVYKDLKSLAADYNYFFLNWFAHFVTWIFEKVYDGIIINPEGLELIKSAMKDGPCIFIPSHKSHIDYLVLSHTIWKHGIVPPHIAAGINLSFWPAGFVLRRSGAFFIKRTFKGDELYKIAVQRYIDFLLREKYNIEFFIEGTRSRTGKTQRPRYGILSMIMNSFENNVCDKMSIFPIAVSFDKIIDVGSYVKEQKGAEKSSESAGELLQSRKILKRKYGKVYIQIGNPINLSQYTAEKKRTFSLEGQQLVENVGNYVINRINDNIVVTPTALLGLILLTSRQKAYDRKEILTLCEEVIDYCITKQINLSEDLTANFEDTIDITLKMLLHNRVIEIKGGLIVLREFARGEAQYNLYTIIHFFLSPMLAVISLKKCIFTNEFNKDSFRNNLFEAKKLLSWEFFFPNDENLLNICENFIIELFDVKKLDKIFSKIDHKIIAEKIINPDKFYVSDRALISVFESYQVFLQEFLELEKEEMLSEKELLNNMIAAGDKKFIRGEITRPESVSLQAYKSALDFLVSKGSAKKEKDETKKSIIEVINYDYARQFLKQITFYLFLIRDWETKNIIY